MDYLQPQLDPQTRTLKVRLEAANPGTLLKPDMFVDVEFPLATSRQLTVPVDAVLDAGQRQTVFVDRGNGYLEPREVEIGDRLGDRIEILRGLKAGERIVTSANFLIDSESQLKAAVAGMSGPAQRSLCRRQQHAAQPIQHTKGRTHDQSHHRVQRPQQVLRVSVGGLCRRLGRLVDAQHAARRDSGPQRHAGDRLFALGPQPGHHGRPGHVPDRDRHAGRAEGEGRARLFGLRLFVRLHHFRRRHGYLLGALAHARSISRACCRGCRRA